MRSFWQGLAGVLLAWGMATTVFASCPDCPDTSASACRRWGAGRAKFQWASGGSVSSNITLTAGTCGEGGENAVGYIFSHTDTHTRVCNGKTVCNDGLWHQETLAVIRVTGDQKAFQHIFGSIGFTGDKVYTTYLGAQYYGQTTVTQTDCDYPLVLSDPSGSRIRVSASVGQCDPQYDNSKFNIIIKFYEVLSGSSGPNRYSLLSSVTGTITVKTNSSREFDPISFKPDLRDGSSMAELKQIVRNYSENGGQHEWSMNYREGYEGWCQNQQGWCGPWGGIAFQPMVPSFQTFYRVKYPGWETPVQGQPPYVKETGWNYDSSGGRLVYEMGDLGRMYYHLQTTPDGTVRLRTVERCESGQPAGQGTVQWTIAYDEQDRIRYIHNASYADPNNPPDPNDIADATLAYQYEYDGQSNNPTVTFKSRPTTVASWQSDRQWQLEFDDQGRAVKFQGGCGSCSGAGSFEHVAYHENFADTIIRRMNADGVILVENDYEELEFGHYETAGWLYLWDGDFEQQNIVDECDLFENQSFGWNSSNLTITAQICDPNNGSQYLNINSDTVYQELYPVMSNTRYQLDISIRAHIGQQDSYALVELYAVRAGSIDQCLGEIALSDVDMQDGVWEPYSLEWDSKHHPDLIDFFNPWRLKIVLTGDNVDMDAVKLSTNIWVGGNTRPLLSEQRVWAQGYANPVTALKRTFTMDRDTGTFQVVERRFVRAGQDVCQVTVIDYADDSFTTATKRTEYANLGTTTTLPTGDSFVTTFGGDDPNAIYYSLSPNGKRADVQIYEYGNLVESYIQNRDNDANSLRELYEYEELGWDTGERKLTKHINARGGVTEYEYYQNEPQWRGLLKKQTDPNTAAGRQVTEYLYDSARRVIRQTQTLDAERTITTRYFYNPITGYLDAVSVNGVNTQYYYNPLGQVIRQVDPDKVVTGKSYGQGGEIVSEFVISANTTDPNGVDTSLTLISQTRTTYTANGQIELLGQYKSDEEFTYQSDMTTNPANWIVTRYEYTPDGKQKKVIEDYGTGRTNLTTEYFYNLQGEIDKVLYPTGKWVKTVRDGRGLVILEETGHSADTVVMQSAYAYDDNGNLQWQKNTDGTEVHYTYDHFDRIKRVYQGSLDGPYAERFYTEAGDIEREIACEADGTVLSDRWMAYDTVGQLRSERLCAEPNSLDNAADRITYYTYDVSGNLRFEIKAGLSNADPNGAPVESDVVTELRYDDNGRRVLTIDPKGIGYGADYTRTGRVMKTISPIDPSDPNAFITSYHYDPIGRLEKTVDPLGHYNINVYNSLNQVIRQTVYDCNSLPDVAEDDYAVRQTRMTYDNLGNIIRQAVMADPASEGEIVLGVDWVSDTVYDPNGTGQVYQQKTYIGTEATLAVTTFYYDAIGRLRKTVDPEGNEEIITYYTDGNPSQVRLIEQKQVDSEDSENVYTITTFLEYDDFGRLYKRILDEDGNGVKDAGDPATTYTYDGMGRLKTETANDGVVTYLEYDGFGNVKAKIDDYGTGGAENRTTEFVYNRLNQQWKVLAYDPNDTTQDVDIQVTEYAYDFNGNVTHITYPDEKSVEYVYNHLNKVDTEIQRNGTEIYYWYDQAGNLRFESDDPDGPDSMGVPGLLTEFRYDAARNLVYASKWIEWQEISESIFTYNGFGARTSETIRYDGDFSQTTTWTYDGSGNRLTQTHGQTILAASHDGIGRIKTLNRGNDHIVAYVYMGNRTKSIEYPEPGVVQAFGYDALGRVEQVRSSEGVDQTILDFIYTYDEVGNRDTVKYNHLSVPVWDRYYYDTLNRLWKVEYAQTSGFALADGRPLSELAMIAAEWLDCECDFTEAANRAYQAMNNRKQRLKESIEQNGLDEMVRSHPFPFEHWIVKTETDMDAPIYALAEFGESKANYRTETCTDEAGNIIARILWDSSDRMILFAMYPASGGTVVVSMGYDSQASLISNIFTILDADGKITETIDMLAYQAQQELEQKQQVFLDSLSASRTLDDGGMTMMAMSSPESPTAACEIFLYDHLGNRYQETTKNGLTYTYSHNAVNQYADKKASFWGLEIEYNYSHDDNGNLEMDAEGYTYSYDYRNRLIKVDEGESNAVAEYVFDALGRRISKTVDGATTYFIYDPQGRVIAEYENDTLTKEFIYGNGFNEVLAMFLPQHEGNPEDWQEFLEFCEVWLSDPNDFNWDSRFDVVADNRINLKDFAYFASLWDMPSNNETRFYYLRDALGSVRGLIGGRFNRESDREFYNYDVYGKSTDSSAVGNPFRFAGYRLDVETGLYHTPFRTYEPDTARWLQPDPKGYIDGMNLYEYVRSSPVRFNDPWGLGVYVIGPPTKPNIQHDNGFLDSFPQRPPTWRDEAALLWWKTKLNAAELMRPDLPDATKAYRHFLYGNGTDFNFSYDKFASDDPAGQSSIEAEISDAQRYAEQLRSLNGNSFQMTGSAVSRPNPTTENWQKAIGGHSIWGAADVTVECKKGKTYYTMNITIYAEDMYNFNPGQADIATGIPDSANGRFEITGLGRQFMQYSQSHRTVKWEEGDFGTTKIERKDRRNERSRRFPRER